MKLKLHTRFVAPGVADVDVTLHVEDDETRFSGCEVLDAIDDVARRIREDLVTSYDIERAKLRKAATP